MFNILYSKRFSPGFFFRIMTTRRILVKIMLTIFILLATIGIPGYQKTFAFKPSEAISKVKCYDLMNGEVIFKVIMRIYSEVAVDSIFNIKQIIKKYRPQFFTIRQSFGMSNPGIREPLIEKNETQGSYNTKKPQISGSECNIVKVHLVFCALFVICTWILAALFNPLGLFIKWAVKYKHTKWLVYKLW